MKDIMKFNPTPEQVGEFKKLLVTSDIFLEMEPRDQDFVNKQYEANHWRMLCITSHEVSVGFLSQFEPAWDDEILSPFRWAEKTKKLLIGHGLDALASYLAAGAFLILMDQWESTGQVPDELIETMKNNDFGFN